MWNWTEFLESKCHLNFGPCVSMQALARLKCISFCLYLFVWIISLQSQSTIFCVRCGTPRGIITHWLRSETHRDMAAWARSLVQGTHNAINYQREFSFRCVFQVRGIIWSAFRDVVRVDSTNWWLFLLRIDRVNWLFIWIGDFHCLKADMGHQRKLSGRIHSIAWKARLMTEIDFFIWTLDPMKVKL